jgi:hypothetical protein
MRHRILVLAIPLLCGGCAGLFHGTKQRISLSVDPDGAQCGFWRGGTLIGQTLGSGSIVVAKSPDPIIVVCDKPHYREAKLALAARADPIGSLDTWLEPLGMIVGAMPEAAYIYDASVSISLTADDPRQLRRSVIQH